MERKTNYEELRKKVRQLEQEISESKRSEKIFRIIFDYSPQAIALTEAESGKIEDVNEAFCQEIGAAKNQLLGLTINELNLFPKNEREKFQERLLETGTVQGLEITLFRIDGTIKFIKTFAKTLLIDKIQYALIMFHDITKQKEAEEAFRQSQQNYRLLADNTVDVIWTLDLGGRYTFVTPSIQTLFDFTPQETIGTRYSEHLPREEREILDKAIAEAYDKSFKEALGEIILREEFRQIKKDGSQFWSEVLICPLRNKSNDLIGFQGSTRDITERKRAEEALRDSEDKYRKLFNAAQDAIALIDEKGNFLTVNPSMLKRLNKTKAEMERKTLYDVFPENLADSHLKKGKEAMELGKVMFFEDEKEGKCFQNYYVPVSTLGRQKTFQIISRDITEQKKADERLRYQTFYDPLTGLYNRSFFEELMKRFQDGRYSPVGIIICDVDSLKFINDNLGRKSGDNLLINTANLLKEAFPSGDIISRIGADEFAVFVAETDHKNMKNLVRRFNKYLQKYNNKDPRIPLFLSIGYAVSSKFSVDTQDLIKQADNRLSDEKLQRGQDARYRIVKGLMRSMETRDFFNKGHCEHLQQLVTPLARSLKLHNNEMEVLNLLARFHDLGKVGIPDHILFKPGSLTEEESEKMHKHCIMGYLLSQASSELIKISECILKHHEWWDGQGYPIGLKGEDIPLPCRILSIAEAYEVMINGRPYRIKVDHEEAIGELRKNAGSQFDPELVEKFIKISESIA